jgi:hypothetical protein
MDLLGVKENTFSCRRLPGINMGNDADVSHPIQRDPGSHQIFFQSTIDAQSPKLRSATGRALDFARLTKRV